MEKKNSNMISFNNFLSCVSSPIIKEKKIRRIERRRGESGQSTMALLRRKLVSSDADRCIQGTNDDASVSKM